MPPTIASLRVKLDRLAAADPKARLFGAAGPQGHEYRERPRWSAAELATVEAAYGVAFPAELVAFLCELHGGGPGPGYGFLVETPSSRTVRAAQPFPYDAGDAARLLVRRQSEPRAGLPAVEDSDDDDDWPPGPGFIALAHHGCGMFDVIVTSGEQRGRVWFFDMQWFPRTSSRGGIETLFEWYDVWLDDALRACSALEGTEA